MPRRKRDPEMVFFEDENRKLQYNILCRGCKKPCKQSFRVIVVECRRYESRRAARDLPKSSDANAG